MADSLAQTVLIALVGGVVVAAVLCVWGLRGRRVGQEPRCRKCRYNLTGLTAVKCPECGTDACGRNVVVGVRRRRWRALGPGLVLLVISLGGLGSALYVRSKKIGLYPYLPVFVLIQQARGNVPPAIRELIRRQKAGSVSGSRLVELTPLALRQQGLHPFPASGWAWTDLLAALEVAGHLSRAEVEQFHDQVGRFEIFFRSPIRQRDKINLLVRHLWLGSPALNGKYTLEDGLLRLGPWTDTMSRLKGGSLGSSGRDLYSPSFWANQFEPGIHEIKLRVTKVFSGPSFKKTIELSYEIEILSGDGPDTVRLIGDLGLAGDFKRAITIVTSDTPLKGYPDMGKPYIQIAVDGRIPMDGAFELYGRVGDGEVRLGGLTVRKSRSISRRYQWSFDRDLIGAPSFIPILRTSVKRAKETLDMVEIWNGELRFDPVEVPVNGDQEKEP